MNFDEFKEKVINYGYGVYGSKRWLNGNSQIRCV